ncbi:hypothetical protein VDGL01_06772 [Verticillium dahliae]
MCGWRNQGGWHDELLGAATYVSFLSLASIRSQCLLKYAVIGSIVMKRRFRGPTTCFALALELSCIHFSSIPQHYPHHYTNSTNEQAAGFLHHRAASAKGRRTACKTQESNSDAIESPIPHSTHTFPSHRSQADFPPSGACRSFPTHWARDVEREPQLPAGAKSNAAPALP